MTEHTSISIDTEDALTFNHEQFVEFFHKHVHGSEEEATTWANIQITMRAAATRAAMRASRMKDIVLSVVNVQKDEEYTRVLLKGSNPYYEGSDVTLVFEYEEEILNVPETGTEFILKLKDISENK